jgi:hypothetical protein
MLYALIVLVLIVLVLVARIKMAVVRCDKAITKFRSAVKSWQDAKHVHDLGERYWHLEANSLLIAAKYELEDLEAMLPKAMKHIASNLVRDIQTEYYRAQQ